MRKRSLFRAKGLRCVLAAGCGCIAALPALAQYPGQVDTSKTKGPDMRAVAVVEWTGDLKHPTASRVIPITVWDGQNLQDAGIYLAQPAPLALDAETEYVLQQDGRKVGLFDIEGAANQGGTWIGTGKWKALPTGPSPAELAQQQAKVKIDDFGSDEPVLHRKHHAGDAGTAAKAGSPAGGASAGSGPPPDPDRPTLHKSGDSGDTNTASSGPPPDPDRPRLHADTDKPAAQKPAAGDDEAHVEDMAKVDDSDRPRLMRGKPAEYSTPDVKPSVIGTPPDMHQQIAVSDTRTLKDHAWDFSWANPGDEEKMKAAMEAMARKAMGLDQPAPAPAPVHRRTTAATRRKTAPAPPPAPIPLEDEQFRVLELAYGQGATMVLSARSKGAGAGEKFVTLIAQPDLYGSAILLYKNVTDADHLDLRPRMRLVDAVDAEGDNRGELLFELRGKTQREFALYRVLRGQATQIFLTQPLGAGAAAAE